MLLYPLVLLFLIWYDLGTTHLAVALAVFISVLTLFLVAGRGARLQFASVMVAAAPLRKWRR
jgi:hypothetical protein